MALGAADLLVLSEDGPHVPEIKMHSVKERRLLLCE